MIDSAYALPSGPPADGDELASTLGWHSWCNWIMARASDYPESAHLACFGWADQFDSLDQELLAVIHACDDQDVSAVTAQVLAALRARPDDAAALIATDGEPGEEGGTQESVDIFRAVREERQEGEKWQTDSGQWMMIKGGRPIHIADPNKSPASGAKPTGDASAALDHATAKGLLARIEKSNLPPEKKEKYAAAMKSVLSQMPKEALDRIRANVKLVAFHASTKDIGNALADFYSKDQNATDQQRADAERLRGRNIGGAYVAKQFQHLHLDGDHEHGVARPGRHDTGASMPTAAVHAHEMTHAIDGPEHEITNSPEWQQAYAHEIAFQKGQEPPLSTYAGTKPSEGLAEFGRLVYGSDVPHAQIAREFPQATAAFKARGLWPSSERTGTAAKMSEVFEERIQLPDSAASHADTLKTAAKESIFREEADHNLVDKLVTVHRSDGTTVQQHRKVRADAEPEGNGEHHTAELHDDDRTALVSGIDKAVAELPEQPPEGLVAKAKDVALTAAAKLYLWAVRLTPAALKVGAVLGEVLDVPADMKKFAYNPTAAGGQEHGGLGANDFVKTGLSSNLGVGISGHLVATIASQVLSRAFVWAKRKLAGGASEAVEPDGVMPWAEMLAQLYAHLAPALGLEGDPPKAEAIASTIRQLIQGNA